LLEWCGKYRAKGLEGLKEHRGGAHRAKLNEAEVQDIADKLRQYTPHDLFGPETYTSSGQHWTVEDLVRAVERWQRVIWKSRSSYRDLLARCGFTYQRTEKVYKSRRESDVMDLEGMVEKS